MSRCSMSRSVLCRSRMRPANASESLALLRYLTDKRAGRNHINRMPDPDHPLGAAAG